MRNVALLGAITLAFAAPASAHAHDSGCPAGVPTQTITVVNQAAVPATALAKVERAVTAQSLQLRAAWDTRCVIWGPGGWPLKLAKTTDCMHTTTSPRSPCLFGGSLGYHNGKPESPPWTGRFIPTWGEVETNNDGVQPWSVTFSHETLEMLANQSGLAYYLGSPLEICDPVQSIFYRLRGVWVSDFVTKAWFHSYGHTTFSKNTRFDWARQIHAAGDDQYE